MWGIWNVCVTISIYFKSVFCTLQCKKDETEKLLTYIFETVFPWNTIKRVIFFGVLIFTYFSGVYAKTKLHNARNILRTKVLQVKSTLQNYKHHWFITFCFKIATSNTVKINRQRYPRCIVDPILFTYVIAVCIFILFKWSQQVIRNVFNHLQWDAIACILATYYMIFK